MKILIAIIAFVLLVPTTANASDNQGKVVASIKPIHSLVENVLGNETAVLIVGGNSSPHDYQFKPSQISALNKAEIVFYVDDRIEGFMKKPLANLPEKTVKVKLADVIELLDIRSGRDFEKHSHDEHDADEDDHDAEEHSGKDLHIWMSPKIAIKLVGRIEAALAERYPENADIYKANALATIEKLEKLDEYALKKLAAVKKNPFMLFHDAFQYLEKDYELEATGSISLDPEKAPSIHRVAEVKKKIEQASINCVFTEPQFNKKPVEAITNGSKIFIGELDEHGAGLKEGKELYFELIRKNVDNYSECLKQ